MRRVLGMAGCHVEFLGCYVEYWEWQVAVAAQILMPSEYPCGRFGSRSSIFEVTVCAWKRAQLHTRVMRQREQCPPHVPYEFL